VAKRRQTPPGRFHHPGPAARQIAPADSGRQIDPIGRQKQGMCWKKPVLYGFSVKLGGKKFSCLSLAQTP
jgi:hypothetical protein